MLLARMKLLALFVLLPGGALSFGNLRGNEGNLGGDDKCSMYFSLAECIPDSTTDCIWDSDNEVCAASKICLDCCQESCLSDVGINRDCSVQPNPDLCITLLNQTSGVETLVSGLFAPATGLAVRVKIESRLVRVLIPGAFGTTRQKSVPLTPMSALLKRT